MTPELMLAAWTGFTVGFIAGCWWGSRCTRIQFAEWARDLRQQLREDRERRGL